MQNVDQKIHFWVCVKAGGTGGTGGNLEVAEIETGGNGPKICKNQR